ncbi:MAG: cyclic-di-GMP receptor FimW [Gammaproteobacteria bacterium]
MTSPRLHIPNAQPGSLETLPVQFNRVPEWLESLPVANTHESANQLLTLLSRLNRYPLGIQEREGILGHCRPVVETLIAGLRKPLVRAAHPLHERPRKAADTLQRLLTELAIGYKILVRDITTARLASNRKHRLGEALLSAHHFLAELVVHCYSLYVAVPSGTWSDLHELFSFTREEAFGVRDQLRDDLGHAYKRICLLALTNPYQLMEGEARRVYEKLDAWADSVEMTRLTGVRPPEGVYYTDLHSDQPPRYAVDANNPETEEAYAFAVDGLLRRISQRLKELIAAGELRESRMARQERDLLLRLERAWTQRRRRRFPRTQHLSEITLAGSLSACHYYVSDGAEFNPETKELAIRQKTAPDLELIPEDYKPWNLPGSKTQAVPQGSSNHTASFRARDLSSDIWHQIYVTEMRDPDEKYADPAFPAAPLFQLDESVGGLCVRCAADSPLRLQVGELVAYELGEPRDPGNWRIGAIRWLIQNGNGTVDVGIKRLARNAQPVAARAVRGVGKESGYFRSLLIPRTDPREKTTALIVPSGVYDVGSLLALEYDDEMLYAQLTKMLETTGCYTVFAFQLTEEPGERIRRTALETQRKIP